jgi:hypothetical protein
MVANGNTVLPQVFWCSICPAGYTYKLEKVDNVAEAKENIKPKRKVRGYIPWFCTSRRKGKGSAGRVGNRLMDKVSVGTAY